MSHRFLQLTVNAGKIPCGNHQYPFGLHIYTNGNTRRNQCFIIDNLHIDGFEWYQAEKLQIHGVRINIFRI